MPVLLEKLEEFKKEASEVLENSKEVIKDSVDDIDINKDNISLSDNSTLLLLAIVVAIAVLAKPFYGTLFFILRIGLICLLGYFALIFLVLS